MGQVDAIDELVEAVRYMIVRYEDSDELPTPFSRRLIGTILGHKRLIDAIKQGSKES
jgi:hypothetical protein